MRIWKLGLVAFVLSCLALLGGWGMAQALTPNSPAAPPVIAQNIPTSAIKKSLGPVIPENPRSVDPIPTRYIPGFESYIQTCTGCHIALPPEVLPLESWQEILRRPDEHYGVSVPNINRFTQLLIWDYVSTFSRPLPPNSPVPIYTEKSRYFKALHPKVPLAPEMTAKTCVACHPQAPMFDFVTLTPEWQDAP